MKERKSVQDNPFEVKKERSLPKSQKFITPGKKGESMRRSSIEPGGVRESRINEQVREMKLEDEDDEEIERELNRNPSKFDSVVQGGGFRVSALGFFPDEEEKKQ